MQNFCLTVLTFRVTFTPLTFCISRYLNFSQSQFQAAELNWRQFTTPNQMKSAPKLVPKFTTPNQMKSAPKLFFTLNLNSGIY